jgi:hypothetical protein
MSFWPFSKIPLSSTSNQLLQHEQNSAFPRALEDARAGEQSEDDHALSTLDEPPNQNTDAAERVEDPSFRPHHPVLPLVPSASSTSTRAASETESIDPPNVAQHQGSDDLIGGGQTEELTTAAEHDNVGHSGATSENAPRRPRLRKIKASQRLREQARGVGTQQTSIDWLHAWAVVSTIVIAYLLAVVAGVL